MFYTTWYKQNKVYNNIDYLELIINNEEFSTDIKTTDLTKQITIETEQIPNFVYNIYNNYKSTIDYINFLIKTFLQTHPDFLEHKGNYYREFRITKRKGGWRYLIEPNEELKALQQQLLNFFSKTLHIKPHYTAHAFIEHKDAYTNAEIHKDSDYVIKFDFSDFFPSITKALLIEKLHNISLFWLMGAEFVNNLAEIATYKDCLPQGSPLSPYLSNIIMTEFDYTVKDYMRLGIIPNYKYTRYADDLTFSAKTPGEIKKLTQGIKNILKNNYYNLIKLNEEKTKILKITNKCYITGVKLNKDHELTYGHEKKTELKHEICNMLIKFQNNELTKEEAQSILGKWAYMKRIEPKYAEYLAQKYLRKFNSRAKTLYQHLKTIL